MQNLPRIGQAVVVGVEEIGGSLDGQRGRRAADGAVVIGNERGVLAGVGRLDVGEGERRVGLAGQRDVVFVPREDGLGGAGGLDGEGGGVAGLGEDIGRLPGEAGRADGEVGAREIPDAGGDFLGGGARQRQADRGELVGDVPEGR
jgi:hypothetical protein